MDLIDEFLGHYSRVATQHAYAHDLRVYLTDCDWPPDSSLYPDNFSGVFSPENIRSHFLHARQNGVGSSVLRRRRAVLSAFLRWVQSNRLARVEDSIAAIAEVRAGMTHSPSRQVMLDRADIDAILNAAHSSGPSASRDQAVILTTYLCCLRRSEIARIDVEHIRRFGTSYFIDVPSTPRRPAIFVRLPLEAQKAIRSMREEFGISAGHLWRSLSNNSSGRRLSGRSIHRIIRRAALHAGYDDSVNADTIRFSGLLQALRCDPKLLGEPPAEPVPIRAMTIVKAEYGDCSRQMSS